MEIKKVYTNKESGQKLITIPSSSNIQEGDFVLIDKVEMKGLKEIQLENLKDKFPEAYKWHMENMEKQNEEKSN